MSHSNELLPSQWEELARTFVRAERVFCFDDRDDLPLMCRRFSPEEAHDLQTRLLPTRPPHIAGFDIEAVSYPSAIVGGDHFNFCSVVGDKVGIVIFDVSGKGFPAALLAMRLRSIFRTQTWGNRNVADVLVRVHEFLCLVLPPAHFVTAIYGILDPNTRRFTFARAGHEPLLRVRPAQQAGDAPDVELFAPAGLPLGIGTRSEFQSVLEVETVALEPGDRLLLFTDGLTEAQNSEHDEFGMERIVNTLCNSTGNDIRDLRDAVADFCQGQAPHDDLTMISLTVQ